MRDALAKEIGASIPETLLFTFFLLPMLFFAKFYWLYPALIAMLLILRRCSRILTLLLLLLLSLSSLVYVHIVHHWGGKAFDARVEVALVSPLYEMKEYLQSYIDIVDITALLYYAILLFSFWWLSRKSAAPRPSGNRRIVCGLILIVFLVSSKNVPPMKFFKEIYKASERNAKLEDRLKNIEQNRSSISSFSLYDRVVIVIGESASSHHMGVYGYPRPTTPFASSERVEAFRAFAPTNQTRFSVPLILSDVDLESWQKFYRTPSLPTLFRNAGFTTHWISNQRTRGKNDTNSASLASEADQQVFLNQKAKSFSAKDQVILDYLSSLPEGTSEKKEAWFIHLMGSHKRYRSRYDKNATAFGEKRLVDRYDNSILYTDYILSKLYEHFKGKKLLMLYFSDHGEIVKKGGGHGFNPPFRDEYDVPFLVLSTIQNPYLETMKMDNEKKKFNLDDLPCYLRNLLNGKEVCRPRDGTKVMAVTPSNLFRYEELPYSDTYQAISPDSQGEKR